MASAATGAMSTAVAVLEMKSPSTRGDGKRMPRTTEGPAAAVTDIRALAASSTSPCAGAP